MPSVRRWAIFITFSDLSLHQNMHIDNETKLNKALNIVHQIEKGNLSRQLLKMFADLYPQTSLSVITVCLKFV